VSKSRASISPISSRRATIVVRRRGRGAHVISIHLNADAAISKLSDLELRQLPYAMKLGSQSHGRGNPGCAVSSPRQAFTIRRPWVQKYGIKIGKGDFATKEKAWVTIQINPDADFLIKFEDGGLKRPRGSAQALAIPIEARRNKADIVQASQRPRAFQFQRASSSVGSRTTIYRGNNNTMLLQKPDGSGVILQRMARAQKGVKRGPGQDPHLKLLYILRPTAPIKPTLQFYEIGKRVGHERFAINMQGMLAYAIKTAK
jgi:hypothetical protein